MTISFSPPDISELEVAEVSAALRSGWITTGPRTKLLERQIATFCEVSRAACMNSQTACAEMAMHLLGIGPGDEVITTAYTYTASASVVCHLGAKLILVDTEPGTVHMNYAQMNAAINSRTKAIIPVDIAGIPCDYKKIFEAVEQKRTVFHPNTEIQRAIGRVAVCADAAHAFGAKWHGRPVGSIADFSAFSFHAVKNFTTGEGGVLTWRPISGIEDEEIYHRLQLLSLHGQSKDAFTKAQFGTWEYDIDAPEYKCNMTDIAAAIGLAQMKRYPEMLERRREIIKRYDTAFQSIGIETLPHYTDNYESSGHLYMTRVPGITPEQRSDIIMKMAEAGIACNVHYKPLPMMTAYQKLGFHIQDFPNAYTQFANEITLPLHTKLTDEEVAYVIEAYINVVKEYMM